MNMPLFIVFVLFKLLTFFDNVCSADLVEFTRRFDLNGFVCTSSEILFSIKHTPEHPYHCLQNCAGNSSCLSAFYYQNTGRCVGCSAMYSSSEDLSLGFIEVKPETQAFEKKAIQNHEFQKGMLFATSTEKDDNNNDCLNGGHLWCRHGYVDINQIQNVTSNFVSVCPHGWTGWHQSCYKMTSTYASFHDGVLECETDQGHAVHIESTTENEFLQDLFRYKFGSYMYIGTVFDSDTQRWRYHSTGELAKFTFYASGHGSHYPGDKECSGFATVHPTRWYNELCTNNKLTLCEINL